MKLTVADGFPYYVQLTENQDLLKLLSSPDHFNTLSKLTDAQWSHRYAEGKWSIKQIVGHITDHERIMTYRALRFSRKDETPLPGYDQDVLVNNSRFDELPGVQLLEDLQNVRKATLSFHKALSPAQLLLKGKAWKFELTIDEFLRATIGHEMHHFLVLKERYGI